MKNRNTIYQNDIDQIKKQNMDIEAQSIYIKRIFFQINSFIFIDHFLVKFDSWRNRSWM